MDTEQRLLQLEGDLKNAREMITQLSGILQTVPKLGGKDEALHRKLDDILRNQQNQVELERKVDKLTDNVKKVSSEIRTSEEIKQILDAAQTSVGYGEMIVKEIDGIGTTETAMNGKYEDLQKKLVEILRNQQNQQGLERKVDHLSDDVKKTSSVVKDWNETKKAFGKDEDLHKKLDDILRNQQNQRELEKKVDKLADDVKLVCRDVKNAEMKKDIGKDEVLPRKMDDILRNRQNQVELERKMDNLADDVKRISSEIRNSEEIQKIIDFVEISVGYAEVFAKDFEYIRNSLNAMN